MDEYNDLPMTICKHCYWPGEPEKAELGDIVVSFCPCCGSTDFVEVHVDEFNNQFEKTYKQGPYLKCQHGSLRGINLYKHIMNADPQTL